MATKNKQTRDKENAIDLNPVEELLPVNPLLGSQVMTVSDETEQKVELINEIESLTQLAKQELSIKRQKVELEVDNKKLDTALKTISTVDKNYRGSCNRRCLD